MGLAPSTTDLSECKQDEIFYFEDVYFRVENTLYKLPRHHFDDSPHFRDIFDQVPRSPELATPGGTILRESRIHHLQDTCVDDFRQFLRVLYPRHFDDENLTTAQWTSVLKLSTQWGFEKVRAIAIKHLEQVFVSDNKDGFNLLALALRHKVNQWVLPALRLLAEESDIREEFLSEIGLGMGIRVIRLQGITAGVRLEKATKGGKTQGLSLTEIDCFIKRVFPDTELPAEKGPTSKK